MFEILNKMAPEIGNEILQEKTSSYNLRKNLNFYIRNVHLVYQGTESL